MRRMRTFPAIPQSVHAARRFAIDTLSSAPASILEAVELMVSELATNCVRHERTSFHIAILGSSREIRVEVTDSGAGAPRMRSPGPDEPSGRGLRIVDMLSSSWGVQPESPAGKTVWFTVPSGAVAATLASEGRADSERSAGEAAAIARGPSTVQRMERSPDGSTCQRGRGTSSYQHGVELHPVSSNSQGRRGGRRYCQHDECGSHARYRHRLARLG
jgi:serine/threonine-protein kinase RsbW